MITIQYLEDSPELAHLPVHSATERLRRAADRLQFSHLLIGWNLPAPLLEACRAEAERLGIRFLRWHPVLAGDTALEAALDSPVIGPSCRHIPGFRGLPAFTFHCPNHPGVQQAVTSELACLIETGLYQGYFLDRIRFPSPAADPLTSLGCFCEHCRRRAADADLDLEAVRRVLVKLARDPDGVLRFVLTLLGGRPPLLDPQTRSLVQAFLGFRSRSVSELVATLAGQLRGAGLEVGLDCFSPCLTGMVGQDLAALSMHVDWIKVMSYAHTLAPAGLPFELRGLCEFVASVTGLEPAPIVRRIAEALGRPLPETRAALELSGLSPLALRQEVEAGVRASRAPVLAGLELVDVAGAVSLNKAQIREDLRSVKEARPAGLALSWDLRHIPLERLDVVRDVYLES